MGEIPPERIELMADMSLAANRPLNWNLLGSLSPVAVYQQQLTACDRAAERGATVKALALPDLLRMRANRLLDTLPGWREVIDLSDDDRRVALKDPAVRQRLRDGVQQAAAQGMTVVSQWDLVEIAAPGGGPGAEHAGRTIAEVAHELGVEPIEVLLDVVLPDALPLTVVFPSLVPALGTSEQGWQVRAAVWQDDRVVLGGRTRAPTSMSCATPTIRQSSSATWSAAGSCSPSRTQYECSLRYPPVSTACASGAGSLWMARRPRGLRPRAVGSAPAEPRHDLPGGALRLYAESIGVEHVLVAGCEVVERGRFTDALPGTLLRSGVDTDTVTVPGGSREPGPAPAHQPSREGSDLT